MWTVGICLERTSSIPSNFLEGWDSMLGVPSNMQFQQSFPHIDRCQYIGLVVLYGFKNIIVGTVVLR